MTVDQAFECAFQSDGYNEAPAWYEDITEFIEFTQRDPATVMRDLAHVFNLAARHYETGKAWL
jgi:hypothetical protein